MAWKNASLHIRWYFFFPILLVIFLTACGQKANQTSTAFLVSEGAQRSNTVIETDIMSVSLGKNTLLPEQPFDFLKRGLTLSNQSIDLSYTHWVITELTSDSSHDVYVMDLDHLIVSDVRFYVVPLHNLLETSSLKGGTEYRWSVARSIKLTEQPTLLFVGFNGKTYGNQTTLSVRPLSQFSSSQFDEQLLILSFILLLGLMSVLSLFASVFDKDTISYFFTSLSFVYVALWVCHFLLEGVITNDQWEIVHNLLLLFHSLTLMLFSRRFYFPEQNFQSSSPVFRGAATVIAVLIFIAIFVAFPLWLSALIAMLIHIMILWYCYYDFPSGKLKSLLFIVGVCFSLIPIAALVGYTQGMADLPRSNVFYSIFAGGVGQTFMFCLATLHKLSSKKKLYQGSVTELESRVEANNRFLREANQQQRKLIQQLKQANESKNQFLANVSHEIRTPLTSILGYSETLINIKLSQKKRQDAYSVISKSATHLSAMIDDILDLTMIEVNKLSLNVDEMPLIRFFETIHDSFRSRASSKGIVLSMDYQFPLPKYVKCDIQRLRQVVINIVSNAIKFTQVGYVAVAVDCRDSVLTIKVSDTGIGIAKINQQKIFEPFSQIGRQTHDAHGGTGLGLSIALRLCRLMNGTLDVSSEQYQGSCFTITLPIEPVENEILIHALEQERTSSAAEFNASDRPQFLGRVLLAEDQPDNRDYICLLLDTLGLQVDAVEDGLLAVEKLQTEQYDLLLFDIQMPRMDGISALKKAREMGVDAPAVAITANSMKHEVALYLSSGFSNHVAKPIDVNHFNSVLSLYLVVTNSQGNTSVQESQEATKGVASIVAELPGLNQTNESDLEEVDLEFIAIKNRFLKGLSPEIDGLEAAILRGDQDKIAAISHKLKGSAGTFEQHELGKACADLEFIAKSNSSQSEQLVLLNIIRDLVPTKE